WGLYVYAPLFFGSTYLPGTPPLLPGWMQQGQNGVFVNGQSISGNLLVGSRISNDHHTYDVTSIGSRDLHLQLGDYVRIAAVLGLDCHDFGGDCKEDELENNVEMHPVYS